MSEMNKEAFDELLDQLDALDVLEFIDFHPESMQRDGEVVLAFDPLSQNTSGRFLEVDLNKKTFRTTMPDLPEQAGNIIELYARSRSKTLDQAAQELADEFGILFSIEDPTGSVDELIAQAVRYLDAAEKEGPGSTNLREADKRIRKMFACDDHWIEAHRFNFRARLIERNPLTLVAATKKLIELELKAGNTSEAIEVAKKHLEISPQDIMIRGQLAEALVMDGQKTEAISHFMQLAESSEAARQYAKALEAYKRIRDIDSNDVDVYPMILNLLFAEGRSDEAVQEILQYAEQLRKESKFSEAIEQLERAHEKSSASPAVRLALIEFRTLAGLTEESFDQCLDDVDFLLENSHFHQASEALGYLSTVRPNDESILALLISTYQSLQNKEMALEFQLRLAELYRDRDNAPEAIQLLEALSHEHPKDVRVLERFAQLSIETKADKEAVVALGRLARLYIDTGDRNKAADALISLADIDPSRLDAREAAVNLLMQLKRVEDCTDNVKKLAVVLEEKKDEEHLQRVLERIYQNLPPTGRICQMLVASYRRTDKYDKAEEVEQALIEALTAGNDLDSAEKRVRTLIEKEPDNDNLASALGEILVKQKRTSEASALINDLASKQAKAGDFKAAKKNWEKLLILLPEDEKLLKNLKSVYKQLNDTDGLLDLQHRQLEKLKAKDDHSKVISLAKEILALNSDDAKAMDALVTGQLASGHLEDALKIGAHLISIYQKQQAHSSEEALLRKLHEAAPDREEFSSQLLVSVGRKQDEAAMQKEAEAFLEKSGASNESTVRVLRKVSRDLPNALFLHRLLAQLYGDLNRRDDMVAEFQHVINEEERTENYNEALSLYKELLERAPDSISSRQGQVELLRKMGQFEESVRSQLELARLYQTKKKSQEAAKCYEELQQIAPEEPEAYRGHADLLRELKQHDAAMKKLKDLAMLHVRLGRPEMAIATLNDILERQPENHEVRRELVRLKKDEGKTTDAVNHLKRIADDLYKDGDLEGSISAKREAITLEPDSMTLRERLILELKEAGREDEVRQESIGLAEAIARSGQHDKALKVLESAVGDEAENVSTMRARARLFDAMGREQDALKEYRRLQTALDNAESRTDIPVSAVMTMTDDGFDSGLEIIDECDFESFIVGSKNQFAYATSKAVAQHPGSARNPLFLYSDVGLGKTHLLHAIANELKKNKPSIRILYMSTEYFTSELIDAIQSNTVTQFRNRHRKSEVLLLDDVQFLAGKERSQEEFFHIFNMLYQARRQIVVTSDRPPKDISHLDMRLRSRFGQGVIVDIQTPDTETRMAILRADADRRGISVPNDALAVIAERITTNVRELKGAFNQLITQHEIGGASLTEKTAIEILEKYFGA